MRMLGVKASVSSFRWDLVYLIARLISDTRPGVSALAGPIQLLFEKLKTERNALEDAEDAVVIASALVNKKDKHRDEVLVEAGGVARASDKAVYSILFPSRSPTETARMSVADESAEMNRILGEMGKLPADHPIRTEYHEELKAAEAALKAAAVQSDEAVTALALQRSQLGRFKVEVDKGRLSTHGELVTLLKDKGEVDAFFRPTTAAPASEEESPAAPAGSPASPASPATPPTP